MLRILFTKTFSAKLQSGLVLMLEAGCCASREWVIFIHRVYNRLLLDGTRDLAVWFLREHKVMGAPRWPFWKGAASPAADQHQQIRKGGQEEISGISLLGSQNALHAPTSRIFAQLLSSFRIPAPGFS